MTTVAIERLPHALDIPLPSYASSGAAGMDLRAALPPDAPTVIAPHARAIVPCGIRLALPAHHEGQVRPRSGVAGRHGVTVLNAPGTIDNDFRGEIAVILINLGNVDFTVRRGDRIAQLVIAPIATVSWREASLETDRTVRGAGGFGSTGLGG